MCLVLGDCSAGAAQSNAEAAASPPAVVDEGSLTQVQPPKLGSEAPAATQETTEKDKTQAPESNDPEETAASVPVTADQTEDFAVEGTADQTEDAVVEGTVGAVEIADVSEDAADAQAGEAEVAAACAAEEKEGASEEQVAKGSSKAATSSVASRVAAFNSAASK